MTTYQAVLWDIGGVIVELRSIRDGYATFVDELATEYDLDADEPLERWKSTLGDHFKGREGSQYRLAREGYAKATADLFDGDPPADWSDRLEVALEASLRPEDGAVETIAALSGAGFDLAIVSDVDTPEGNRMLETLGVREYFDHVTTSEAIGHTKPDERMFRDALDALDVDPGDAIVVGDRHSHDIVGAAALGIDAVGYGEDARGPETDYEIDDLRELLAIVGADEARR